MDLDFQKNSLISQTVIFLFFVQVGFNSCDANEVLGPYERPFRDQSSALPMLCKEKESLRNKLFKAITEDNLQGLDALVDTQVCFGVQDFDKRTPL